MDQTPFRSWFPSCLLLSILSLALSGCVTGTRYVNQRQTDSAILKPHVSTFNVAVIYTEVDGQSTHASAFTTIYVSPGRHQITVQMNHITGGHVAYPVGVNVLSGHIYSFLASYNGTSFTLYMNDATDGTLNRLQEWHVAVPH